MHRKTKKLFAVLLAVIMLLCVACKSTPPGVPTPSSAPFTPMPTPFVQPDANNGTAATPTVAPLKSPDKQYGPDDTWAIYWYLCGADLESEYGHATEDLAEMMRVGLPKNVFAVVQTGGAKKWHTDLVKPKKTCRFLYNQDGMKLVEEKQPENMGSGDTFEEFLRYCTERYPADHQAVIIWNHGGGSVDGVAFDEQYDDDSLTLEEIQKALDGALPINKDEPPLELIGFDACLMATIDTAHALAGAARYMVASEELELGGGWDYAHLFNTLAASPALDGAHVGKAIVDGYMRAAEREEEEGGITLSVVDLQKAELLYAAYDNLGKEALYSAYKDPAFFSKLGRAANAAENYGGNTREEGYANMVDLGDFVRQLSGALPTSAQAVLNALDACVLYKYNGQYRAKSSGLSCFFSYDLDKDNFSAFMPIAASEAFMHLYEYGVSGKMTKAGLEYLSNMQYTQLPALGTMPEIPPLPAAQPGAPLPEAPVLTGLALEKFPVIVDAEGNAVLNLGPNNASLLTGVYFDLARVDTGTDKLVFLGRDNNLYMDWELGVFQDNFFGSWGSIDGHHVQMEIVYEGEKYNLYSVPILLNGEEYNLRVSYDYDKERYDILGARKGIGASGMADKNLTPLRPGDIVTPIQYQMIASTPGADAQKILGKPFTVTETTAFYDEELPDGSYMMMFEMVDARNNMMFSNAILWHVEGEYITAEQL